VPEHALLQHTPSVQLPCAHSVPSMPQVPPLASLQLPSASHACVPLQTVVAFVSCVPATVIVAHVPLAAPVRL
jgi:hypothetical protein